MGRRAKKQNKQERVGVNAYRRTLVLDTSTGESHVEGDYERLDSKPMTKRDYAAVMPKEPDADREKRKRLEADLLARKQRVGKRDAMLRQLSSLRTGG